MIIILILLGILVLVFLCMLKSAGREELIQENVKYSVNKEK